MATPTKAQRDANLDQLQAAANQYLQTEIARLDSETQFLRSVLQRRGATQVAALNLNGASSLVQQEIEAYLRTG